MTSPDPIPTAELHLHLEGTLEPELLVALARRNGIRLASDDVEELRARYVFDDLQAFLDVFYDNYRVLLTEEDFYDLGRAYLARARAGGVVHAEAFTNAMPLMERGVPLEAILGGYRRAFAEARTDGFSCELIFAISRDRGEETGIEVLRRALAFRDDFVGIGLDSTEVGYPPHLYGTLFGIAASEGLHRVAHAGEEGGPEYVRDSIDLLHVERIDHGTRSVEDPDLVRKLVDEGIAVTACPLSNVALKVVPSVDEHPLRELLEAGVRVTVNSDDPAYFGGYVDDNFRALRASGYTDDELRRLARNSFDAAFVDDARRAQLHALLG